MQRIYHVYRELYGDAMLEPIRMDTNMAAGSNRNICHLSATMIKFLSLDILGVSQRALWKNENAVYRLQIPALVPEIFKFEKCVKYANEMTDDVIHSTEYYITYINRAIFANLHRRPLKLGRLIVLQKTHLRLRHILFPWQLTLFQSPPTWFQYVSGFQLEKRFQYWGDLERIMLPW